MLPTEREDGECVRLQLQRLRVKIKPRLTYIITSFKVRHWIPTSVLSNCYPRESETRDVPVALVMIDSGFT